MLAVADARLARRLASLERGGAHDAQRPFAFLFSAIFLRLKRELDGDGFEEAKRCWEVSWAAGAHFHILVLAALVRAQRAAILRRGVGLGELHAIFSRLNGTQAAAPLLRAARALRERPAVRAALERRMGEPLPAEPPGMG